MENFASFLEQFGQDSDIEVVIREAIMVYFPQYIENLKSAARDGDLVVLKKQAHSMKGSSASLGMKTLSDYAKELHSATCTDPEEIQRLIALISEELRQNEQIFKDFTG